MNRKLRSNRGKELLTIIEGTTRQRDLLRLSADVSTAVIPGWELDILREKIWKKWDQIEKVTK